MPRLRRAALHRRERPQLNEEVWRWLLGHKSNGELGEDTKWDIFMLENYPLQRDLDAFWNRVRQAVHAGEIEVSPEKVHRMGDPQLVTSE